MPYTEYAIDLAGTQTSMAPQTSLDPPTGFESTVKIEKSNERLELFIKPKGLVIGHLAIFACLYFGFLPNHVRNIACVC